MHEIPALEEQGFTRRFGERIGKAIADIQSRPVTALAEPAERIDREFGLAGGNGSDFYWDFAQQPLDIDAPGVSFASLDNE